MNTNPRESLKKSRGAMLGKGLLPTPKDPRDFDLGAVYGEIDIRLIPNTDWMVVEPKEIKNQTDLDFCAAFMTTEISEDQEDVPLGALWQFAMIKMLMGDYHTWGADLRTAMLSAVKIGSIPESVQDEWLEQHGNRDRDWLANWENWPDHFKEIAKEHCKSSVFKVKIKHYDAFDTVRAALWQHQNDKNTIGLGTMWRYNWDKAEGGVIPDNAEGDGEGHALKACGQKMIGGDSYIVIQNSWGPDVGDRGYFYASRAVFNKYFASFGFFMLKDLPKNTAQLLVDKDLTIESVWWVQPWLWFKKLFTRSTQS